MNEKELCPSMRQLKTATTNKDELAAIEALSEIESLVVSIVPSFVEEHRIDQLLKDARNTFLEADALVLVWKVDEVLGRLESVYRTQLRLRPCGFKRTWKNSRVSTM